MAENLIYEKRAEPQLALFADDELQAVAANAPDHQSIYVHFETIEDLRAFGDLIGLQISTATRWLRFPIVRPETGRPLLAEAAADPLGDVEALILSAERFVELPEEERRELADELVSRLVAALRYAWAALHPGMAGDGAAEAS